MDIHNANGLITKLLDYRIEDNRIILYEGTDRTQNVSFYKNTLEPIEDIPMATFIVIRNEDSILQTIFNPTFEEDIATGKYQYILDMEMEIGDVFYIDLFSLPLLPELKDSDHLNYYNGYFGLIEVGECATRKIVRFDEEDSGRSVPFNPCIMGADDYTIYWVEGSVFYEEITEDDYRNLIEQSHRNTYDRIGESDYYLDYFQVIHEVTGAINVGEPSDSVNELSSAYSIIKKSCNNYELISNEGIDIETGAITVKDEMTGDIIYPNLNTNTPIGLETPLPLSFSVPKDGIYSVTITKTLIPEIGEGASATVLTYSYVFYEHCSLQSCYQKLLKSLYCNDIYCCDSCSTDVQYEKNRRIAEINKMVGLYTQLMLAIHSHHALYFNENPIEDETYYNYFSGIKELWSSISLVYNRCGDCDPSTDEVNNCNC
jgi:hypothetical protein